MAGTTLKAGLKDRHVTMISIAGVFIRPDTWDKNQVELYNDVMHYVALQ